MGLGPFMFNLVMLSFSFSVEILEYIIIEFQQCGIWNQQNLRSADQPVHPRSLIRAFASRLNII